METNRKSPVSVRACLLIQLFLPYLDDMEAQLCVERNWEHRGGFRTGPPEKRCESEGEATVAVVNAKMEPRRISLMGSRPRSLYPFSPP